MFHFGLLDLNDMSVYLESRRTTWTLFMSVQYVQIFMSAKLSLCQQS